MAITSIRFFFLLALNLHVERWRKSCFGKENLQKFHQIIVIVNL